MHLKRITPLAIVMVAGLILLMGCDTNIAPVLGDIVADPTGAVPPGTMVKLTVTATDEDGDVVTFTWTATEGELSSTTGSEVEWTAPAGAGTATITVTADDGSGGTDEGTIDLETRAWNYADIAGETPDSTYLLNPGTTEFAFTWEDAVPAGAYVDSLFLTTDFEPEDSLSLEAFEAYVVAPSGAEMLFYDGTVSIIVEDFPIADLYGEMVDGTWMIKVVRTTAGVEGYADNCDLELYYRY